MYVCARRSNNASLKNGRHRSYGDNEIHNNLVCLFEISGLQQIWPNPRTSINDRCDGMLRGMMPTGIHATCEYSLSSGLYVPNPLNHAYVTFQIIQVDAFWQPPVTTTPCNLPLPQYHINTSTFKSQWSQPSRQGGPELQSICRLARSGSKCGWYKIFHNLDGM